MISNGKEAKLSSSLFNCNENKKTLADIWCLVSGLYSPADPMKGTLVTLCFHLTNVLLTVGTNLLDFRSTLFLLTGTAEGQKNGGGAK